MKKNNWTGSDKQLSLLKPTIEINENPYYQQNPYYQKWKKGRPTKAMLEQRRLWQKWEIENNDLFKLIAKIKGLQPNWKHEEKSFLENN